MTASAENKELLRRIFEALSRGDSRPFVEALAPDVNWTVMGRTRLADRYRAAAQRMIAEGDFVVVQARGSATTKAGVPYDNEYCFVYRLESGAIKEVTEYLDTELVTAALAPA